MTLSDRIKAFAQLGSDLRQLTSTEIDSICAQVSNQNPWFTPDNITLSLDAVGEYLDEVKLKKWTAAYDLETEHPATIGLVMAGNIPLVGFHDVLCVLLSGNHLKAKLSTQDTYLMRYVCDRLSSINTGFCDLIQFAERLNDVDAVIATGSDNSSRYFEYYFRKVPHIIRRNRSSIAIITGSETSDELVALGTDVFSYFGLGCRNVSKLYVPENYDPRLMFEAWEPRKQIANHYKYANNYDYQKSILLINQIPFLDNGFVLLTEHQAMVSPISVLFFEKYTSQEVLSHQIKTQEDKIQCIVSSGGWWPESVPFGMAQHPGLADYSDGVDTLRFVSQIKSLSN